MRQIGRLAAPGLMALTVGIAVIGGEAEQHAARAQGIAGADARIVALNIPGASAIAEVGTFLNVPPPGACANPIPSKFPSYIQPGAILDPKRILVGSRSNFGAPPASGGGQEGSLLSIDPSGPGILRVPANFAQSGGQASTLGGAVQMVSANSPHWLNSVNNPGANTAAYAGVSNPLGLSNNNAFGRIWPANAAFGDNGIGSSSILDPTGLPLAGPPNNLIGGVYVGSLTDRDVVTMPQQAQVILGSLSTGAVGTACSAHRRTAPAKLSSQLSQLMAPSSRSIPSRGWTVWQPQARFGHSSAVAGATLAMRTIFATRTTLPTRTLNLGLGLS